MVSTGCWMWRGDGICQIKFWICYSNQKKTLVKSCWNSATVCFLSIGLEESMYKNMHIVNIQKVHLKKHRKVTHQPSSSHLKQIGKRWASTSRWSIHAQGNACWPAPTICACVAHCHPGNWGYPQYGNRTVDDQIKPQNKFYRFFSHFLRFASRTRSLNFQLFPAMIWWNFWTLDLCSVCAGVVTGICRTSISWPASRRLLQLVRTRLLPDLRNVECLVTMARFISWNHSFFGLVPTWFFMKPVMSSSSVDRAKRPKSSPTPETSWSFRSMEPRHLPRNMADPKVGETLG